MPQSNLGSRVLHPQAVRPGVSTTSQTAETTVQLNQKPEANLQMLRQLLSADIHANCCTGSTIGGHGHAFVQN